MKTFVDVGAHQGQTLEEVVKDRWGFDVIHAIEPMPRELKVLRERYGSNARVQIHPVALVDSDETDVTMYGTNDLLEASLYSTKDDVDPTVRTVVTAVEASEFFFALDPGPVYVDMNCEGAEVAILANLIRSGAIDRIDDLLVSFDISKVRGFEYGEEDIREWLYDVGFARFTSEYPDRPTHQEQIAAWLESVGA